MKLHKKIFEVTEQNSEFLLYLYHHPGFKVHEICEKFNFRYQTFFTKLKEWERDGYIISKELPPELGGIKYTYSLSEKAVKKLKSIKNKWSQEIK